MEELDAICESPGLEIGLRGLEDDRIVVHRHDRNSSGRKPGEDPAAAGADIQHSIRQGLKMG